jgi:mono/diheme cytochrome c family protein
MRRWTSPALVLLLLSFTTGGALSQGSDPQVRGRQLFTYWCATCHGSGTWENRPLPGTGSLQNKYKGALPAMLEDRTDLASPYVQFVIRKGSEGMPFFRKTEISDDEARAIGDYLARRDKK